MRYLCIFSHDGSPRTGGERWLWEIVEHLRKNDVAIAGTSLAQIPAWARKTYLPASRFLWHALAPTDEPCVALLDLYHHAWTLGLARRLGRHPRHRVVVLAQWFDWNFLGSAVKALLDPYAVRLFLRYADLVIANSAYSRDMVAQLGVARERIRIVYPGVDLEQIPLAVPSPARRPLRAVVVGGCVSRKGNRELLRAVRALPRGSTEVSLIGRAPPSGYLRSLQTYVAEHGLEQEVRFVGPLPHEQLCDAYRSAHVFVQPSLDENYGIALVEAMLAGLPVITTTVGIAPEIIRNGDSGLLVPPGDPGRLADALRYVLGNPTAAQAMGRRAREVALEHALTWEESCARVHDCLTEVLGIEPGRPTRSSREGAGASTATPTPTGAKR